MGSANSSYLRVLDDLRAQIREGVLAPGARVPSRNGIIARYGVGETAAKHVLAVLAAEGLIEARPGSGTYVRAAPAPCHLEHDRPHCPGSPFGLPGAAAVVAREHQTERVPAPPHIARRLGLAEGELVSRTRYLLTADGGPVQLAVSYEPLLVTGQATVPPPEDGPFAGRGVIVRMAEAGLDVDQVVENISARPCTAGEAALLGIPPGATVLVVEREHRSGDRVVEMAEIAVAADRYRLRYRMGVTGGAGGQPTVAA